ncbi:bifunctional 5,10-methylenetetrahydrofolate dehydrogenase/5,10-methenyltetrahydrofolate cyclohydrolase [Patescibacteria group bacterium]|nr:bifunctional 5,10-methylenetetrahydrofolate dehydrogenase/5,10-methenyltetrahydrofolate cyclohydrolase [Patescibacteria group bacterium]MBU1500703.1 bifunctional 5,10-methylenetetrahydrofolate dehydrogenase/5,10-methenyltetrahydrofolate cyclohydrolase [Patescibacteria group bacterium]MBU2080979.1 bifunctional 5,10-methylenetetrahydrofolate dehydrogenase/5,10-methenyltetrahydrofolate cyclohydrolase [Patescibacteria group bacterium]MBU2124247.1 bifunctional 5,10-methylenetetrahydrofolate dehydr
MILDGRALAKEIVEETRESLPRTAVVRAVVVSPSPATESYLSIKEARAEDAGMHLEIVRVPETASTEEVIKAVQESGCDSLLVQLPLPKHLDARAILNAIPIEKDADVLSSAAYELFKSGTPETLLPPVVSAIAEILSRENISVSGKRAVVVGQGRLVGEPAAEWLRMQGAEVVVITLESGNLSTLQTADIIVSGAGSPGLITPELISEGVVLIDAGTSEQGGVIVGDALPSCAQKAALFTPVPGGVGPVAVACLFRNAGTLLKRALQVS